MMEGGVVQTADVAEVPATAVGRNGNGPDRSKSVYVPEVSPALIFQFCPAADR
jgi:hypothetical protein